jgi:hypothetical protein
MQDQEGKEKGSKGRSSRDASPRSKGGVQVERGGGTEGGAETGAGEPWDGNKFTGGRGTDEVGT